MNRKKINNPYQVRWEDWIQIKSQNHMDNWDVRAWLSTCFVNFSKFATAASGKVQDYRINVDDGRVAHAYDLLTFFGLYGAVVGSPTPDKALILIQEAIDEAEKILGFPTSVNESIPRNIIDLASTRLAIDSKEGLVSPRAIAVLGGISIGRVHNLMAGTKAVFSSANGQIPATEAKNWLEGRSEYWRSIWYLKPDPDIGEKIRVPVARDGSVFHPGLRRNGHYKIGEKGSEQTVENFDEALGLLQRPSTSRWRRPNANGNWGIVAAIDWIYVTKSELYSIRV